MTLDQCSIGGYDQISKYKTRPSEALSGKVVVAIEVKSGSRKEGLPGMDAFDKEFKPQRKLLVGEDGIPLEKFLLTRAEEWTTR